MRNRSKNAMLSMVSNGVYYLIYIFLGILNRKALVSILGIEYQGANGLFSSVLNVLSIAELGISTAITYHLYRPLAEDDKRLIKVILSFYKKCFNYIAIMMLTIGSIIAIKIEFFVGDNSLPINLRIVYFLMLADVVASYTFAYKRTILYADQRNYVVANINSFFVIGYNTFQIAVLYFFHSYYAFLIVKIIFRIIENIVLNYYVNWKYPYLKEKTNEKLPSEILNDIKLKVKGLLFHKISTFVTNGTDNILISKFVGLVSVGIYSNYNYIIVSINGLIQQIFDATIGSIGNLLIAESERKYYSIFKELNLLNILITSVATAGVYSLANDFVRIIFKDYLLEDNVLFVLCVNMLITGQRRVFGAYKSAAGIQYEDRYVPVCEAIINLGVSLLLVNRFGIIGVFCGTIVSQLGSFGYTFPKLVFKNIIKRTYLDYIKYMLGIWLYQLFAMVSISVIFRMIEMKLSLAIFIFKAIICVLYEIVIFCIIWRKTDEFKLLIKRLNNKGDKA